MSEEQAEAAADLGPLDIGRILAALPHRYPMLLVDRVLSLVPDRSISAVKAVSFNESFFQGHFPGRPIMPGVLIVEALARVPLLRARRSGRRACRGSGVHGDDRGSAGRVRHGGGVG